LVAVIAFAVVGIIVFILTEDMSLPMVLLDNWTIVNAIIFVLGIVSYRFIFKREKNEEYEDENIDSYLVGEAN